MKKLLTTTALIVVLAASGMALAEGDKSEGHDKWRQHKEEILSKLPEEKREAFRAAMQTTRERNKESREQIRKLREEQRAILTAAEFDRAAFLAKSDEIHALHGAVRKNRHAAVADLAQTFTAEERKVLADALPSGHKRKAKPEADE